jgi:hypothetical protein
MVPLLVNAAVPVPRPGVAPALAGIATVREVVGAINADFCILANASASISVRDVAGLDEQQRRRGVGRDSWIRPAERKPVRRHGTVSLTEVQAAELPEPLSACKHLDPAAVRKRSQAPRLGAGGEHSRQSATRPPRCALLKGIVMSAATR